MQIIYILLDEQWVEWNKCECYVEINQLKICECEWYKYQIDVNGVSIGLHVNG